MTRPIILLLLTLWILPAMADRIGLNWSDVAYLVFKAPTFCERSYWATSGPYDDPRCT